VTAPVPATATDIARRIEDLYAAPLQELRVRAADRPPGMLSALLDVQTALDRAELGIAACCARFADLVRPDRPIGPHEVSHLLDAGRRLAEAVAVRDVTAATASAVLQSLGRVPQTPPPAPDPGLPPPSPVPAAAGPSR
jgi:hypothetical protein